MDKFQAKIAEFMRGRYGYDELSKSIFVVVIVLMIASIILNLAGHLFGRSLYVASNIANTVGFVLLFYAMFRALSRNYEARRAENAKFLKRRKKAAAQKDYKYLKCPHCGQEMRVPRGKGKIAVKCPKCKESTIIKS